MGKRTLFRGIFGLGALIVAKVQAIPAKDILLTVPYMVKATGTLTLCGYIRHGTTVHEVVPNILLPATLTAAIALPDLITIGTLAFGSGNALRGVRRYAYGSEMVVGGLSMLIGMYSLSQGGHGSEMGFIPVGVGLLVLLAAQTDAIPFGSEKTGGSTTPSIPVANLTIPF